MSVQHEPHEIHVAVSYVGHDPWKHNFRGTTTVHTVKIEAMTDGFGLEASAAGNYALQLDGADLPEDQQIGKLNKNPLDLNLELKKEPHKGHDRSR